MRASTPPPWEIRSRFRPSRSVAMEWKKPGNPGFFFECLFCRVLDCGRGNLDLVARPQLREIAVEFKPSQQLLVLASGSLQARVFRFDFGPGDLFDFDKHKSPARRRRAGIA